VAVAAYYGLGQIREARRARTLTVLLPLFERLDSPEARKNRYLLFNTLPENLDGELTSSENWVADRIVADYDLISNLVVAGLVDYEIIEFFYSKSFERCWRRLEPWVRRERQLRSGGPFASSFEAVAQRCIRHNQSEHAPGSVPFRRTVQGSSASDATDSENTPN
jgi:hypothetical protein